MKYEDFLNKTAFSQEEVLAFAWKRLVDDPPESFSQLPTPPFLMVDRITEISHDRAKGTIVGERDVRVDDWFFQCHFSNDPVQPGCLGVDAIWQLIGFYCTVRGAAGVGRALGCKEVEFDGQIRPHNKVVRYEIDIRRYTHLKESGTAMAIGNGRVLVDDELIYTVNDAKVGLFTGIDYPDYPFKTENAVGGVMER
jgi:3-hydroxyacyl-[acyl-carrier protein] dehydratase/trans-2-decenoyl-[acyl-carrier protein] isomerase